MKMAAVRRNMGRKFAGGEPSRTDLRRMTADIVAAYARRNSLRPCELTELVHKVFGALSKPSVPEPSHPPEQMPAVPIRMSVQRDHIICLEDGKPLKLLKRYLRSRYRLSPDAYRRKWGLPFDYPMVAPAYAKHRSALAQESWRLRSAASAAKLAVMRRPRQTSPFGSWAGTKGRLGQHKDGVVSARHQSAPTERASTPA
jgi:predicted transcriptional regulator